MTEQQLIDLIAEMKERVGRIANFGGEYCTGMRDAWNFAIKELEKILNINLKNKTK